MLVIIKQQNTIKMSGDGKQTIKQEIEATRLNHPDTLAAYGELTDNSTSWGECSIGSIILEECKTVVIDNGSFKKDKFSSCFRKKKGKDDYKEHYNKENRLGKYNFGLTDSCVLLGNYVEIMTRYSENDYEQNSLDATECKKANDWIQNTRPLTPPEKETFKKLQKINDDGYNMITGKGTIITIKSLRKNNKVGDVKNIIHFLQGLYSPSCHNKSIWKVYDWTNPEDCDEQNPTIIIEPNDLMFGCTPVIDQTIYVYVDELSGEHIYTNTEKTELDEVYRFQLRACFFEKEHLELEEKTFGKNKDRYRTGFQVRRGGRLLTGVEPKLWNLSTGMNHAKGFRVFVDLPVSPGSDEDWCIGTFKKITDDTWKNFNNGLRRFIENTFGDMVKIEEKDRKKKQKEFQDLYDGKLSNLQNINTTVDLKEELRKTKSERDSIMNDSNDKRMSKKGSKSYKSIQKYIDEIESKIKSMTPAPAPEPEPEADDDLELDIEDPSDVS